MKAFLMIAVAFGMTGSTVALAKETGKSSQSEAAAGLAKALDAAVLAQSSPPGQAARPVDPDQGDDNASLRAISVVCSKNTPAARRSAICPPPVSPE